MALYSRARVLLYIVVVIIVLLECYLAGCSANSQFSGRLYFSENHNLVELNLKHDTKKNVLNLHSNKRGINLDRAHYDVSSDSRYIAYVETLYTRSTKTGKLSPSRHLIVLDLYRRKITFKQILRDPILFPVSFSPDSKMLAIVHNASNKQGTPTLEVVRLSDGKTILSSIPAYNNSVAWSPIGSHIGITDVWARPVIIRLSDKKREILLGHGSPRWSPNGKYIAVDEKLWLVQKKRMINLKLPDRAIVIGWSPDSRFLMYTQEDDAKHYPLYAYNIDTQTILKMMSDNGGSDTNPTIWRR